ncbi:uncharacterized protein LOC113313038 [Papaver somniferum]|uniref:uncharacterized protein LOC113313038 n=1 Tax=Papaver somniferum TaxID=3469 RepID=UPI000E704420|nr:uncharacterized protein LOC113313038 [Papaver somniferum]
MNYLTNSYGSSEGQAVAVSKKINLKSIKNPEYVLTCLRNYGFTRPYITKLILKNPMTLVGKTKTKLIPKLDYFISKDISKLEVAKFISSNPFILSRSLEKYVIPIFDSIKNILGTDRDVLKFFQRLRTRRADMSGELMPNIQLLKDENVPPSELSKFLINSASCLTTSTDRFKGIVEQLKDDQIQDAFLKHPMCMLHSAETITRKMDYLVNKMGYSSSDIAKSPSSLYSSLKNRIIPRCSVYQFLVSKGLIIKNEISSTLLIWSEECFLKKLVFKYEVEAPEILNVYHNSSDSTT